MAHRFDCQKTVDTCFVPDVDRVQRTQANRVRAAELGAAFHGSYDKLPHQVAGIMWEHATQPGHVLQPRRPNIYTMKALMVGPAAATRLN